VAQARIIWSGNQSHIVYDALNAYTVRFTYNGPQVAQNRLVVRNNSTNTVVYDHTLRSMRLEHPIPADTLQNGQIYNVEILPYYRDPNGNYIPCEFSQRELVRCLRTPQVTFIDLPEGGIVRNSSVDVTATYNQEQGDLANRYTFKLFDSGHKEIWRESGYTTDGVVPVDVAETVSGLMNNQQYFLSCEIESVAGLLGTTGFVAISVLYQKPRSYSTMYLANVYDQGSIRITSNIKIVDAIVDGDDPVYIDGEWIDLSGGATVISWEDMGLIDEDFQIVLRVVASSEVYKPILKLHSDGLELSVQMLKGVLYGEIEEKMYAACYATNGGITYTTMSNMVGVPASGDKYDLSLVRRGTYYKLELREVAAP
jgi:hypothetical protein